MNAATAENPATEKARRICACRTEHPDWTLKKIASHIGCTSEYVRQVLRGAGLPTKAGPPADTAKTDEPATTESRPEAPADGEQRADAAETQGHWSYAAVVDGRPIGWEGEYDTREDAREAAQAVYDEFCTGRLERKMYADLVPSMHALLNEIKDHAAEHGADVSSFEQLAADDYQLLQDLVVAAVRDWEREWLARHWRDKVCSVMVVDQVEKHGGEQG